MTYDPFLDPPEPRRGCSTLLALCVAVDVALVLAVLFAVRAGRGLELVAWSAVVAAGLVGTLRLIDRRRRRRIEADPRAAVRRVLGATAPAAGFTVRPLTDRDQLFNAADPDCGRCRGLGSLPGLPRQGFDVVTTTRPELVACPCTYRLGA